METHARTLRQLRIAIQANQIAISSPMLVFDGQSRGEIQWRVAELFLIHGWTCARIGRRYGVTRGRIWQMIRGWVDRAQRLGYLQEIPPAIPASAPMLPPLPISRGEALALVNRAAALGLAESSPASMR